MSENEPGNFIEKVRENLTNPNPKIRKRAEEIMERLGSASTEASAADLEAPTVPVVSEAPKKRGKNRKTGLVEKQINHLIDEEALANQQKNIASQFGKED